MLSALLLVLIALVAGAPASAGAAATPTARGLSFANNAGCVVRPAGHVACWGWAGNSVWTTSPTGTKPATLSGVASATQISVGQQSSCARLSTGSVVCWGRNSDGQLGDGTTTDHQTPAPVLGLKDATQVSVGVSFACARRATGAVVCWGSNVVGELGNGTTTKSLKPVAVKGLTDATQVSASPESYWHVCARRSTGAVACWGYNGYGDLGDGTYTNRTTPVAVKGLTNATQVSSGPTDTCARRSTGAVACWGSGDVGQLGNGTTTSSSSVPVAVSGLADATRVAVGNFSSSCARRATGAVVCWGRNDKGQLGDGTTTQRTKPVAVKGLVDASDVAVDFKSSCALRASGAAVCWGDNSLGQLGDGSTTSHLTPYPAAPYPAE